MSGLTLLPGITPSDASKAFDGALDSAYQRATKKPKSTEPHFVRMLISEQTIRELNTVSSRTYDENANFVRFSGGFTHLDPLANFNTGASPTSRELADAIIVLHETQQNGRGVHQVVRRLACLLMFKKKDADNPITLRFDPQGATPPKGTDQEQFFLFNRWPPFFLTDTQKSTSVGSPGPLGTYNIAHLASAKHPYNHGKFAVLWSPNTKKVCKWQHSWRYADPLPSATVRPSIKMRHSER